MPHRFQKRIIAVLMLGLLIVTLVSVAAFHAINRLTDAISWQNHTQEVLKSVENLLSEAKDVETGGRGYFITGEEGFLDPFKKAVASLDKTTGDLQRLTADNPQQEKRIEQLRAMIAKRVAVSTSIIELRRSGQNAAPPGLTFMNEGKNAMDEIRGITKEMEDEEEQLLLERDSKVRSEARITTALILFGGITAIVIVGMSIMLIRKELRRRQMAENALRRARDELETRVAERTAELTRANRALRTISDCNQILVRAPDEASLVREICETVTRAGGYRFAWIGMISSDAAKSMKIFASAGEGGGYLDFINKNWPTWDEEIRARGLFATAIATGKPARIEKQMDPNYASWKTEASKWGFESVIALPLMNASECLGALMLYSTEPDAFDKDEIRLLSELADDLAYGMTALRTRLEHERVSTAFDESERRYQHLIDLCPLAIVVNQENTFTFVNRAAVSLFGASSPDQIVGRSPYEFMHPDVHELVRNRVAQLQNTLKPVPLIEEKIVRLDGTVLDVEVVSTAFTQGGETLLMGIFQDITERKQANRQINQQLGRINLLNQTARSMAERQDLASIFGVVLDDLRVHLPVDFAMAALLDSDGQSLHVSALAADPDCLLRDFAFSPGTVIAIDQNGVRKCTRGQTVYEPNTGSIGNPFVKALAASGLQSLVLAPMTLGSTALGLVAVARKHADAFASGECDFLRQLAEQVALAVNQTRLHETLQQAYDDLRLSQQTVMQQERLRAMGQMASGIAHDINNALGPITLYCESLLDSESNLSERARGQLNIILSSSSDIAETVSRMREFYRLRDKPALATTVNLNDVVFQVVSLTQPRWRDIPQQNGIVIDVVTNLAQNLPTIHGSESEIRDALTNVIFNAVDAMPAGGRLEIRTGHDSVQTVWIEVEDSGAGMDEITRERCMEPFFTTKGERGTGLGLAMVYGMLQRHEGEVEIHSEPGKGTRIRLCFPSAQMKTSPTVEYLSDTKTIGPLHILCIDDDMFIRDALMEILTRECHRVVTAESGQAGMVSFHAAAKTTDPYDLVITDLGMPHMDGREVARAVKKESPGTPVILLTGWGSQMKDEEVRPAGIDIVLSKPPRIRDIRTALAKVLTR